MNNNKIHAPLLVFCSMAIGLNWWSCSKDYPPPPTTTVSIPTNNSQIFLDSIADTDGYTYIARPLGNGPFPGVLYNHGGLSGNIGGDLKGTAIALAEAGYFARAEQ